MARLYVLSGDDLGAVREVTSGAVVGRARDADVPVRGSSISRKHARLEERGGRWYVVDLGSSNGTRVGGRAVTEAALEDGEEFLLGDVEVRFRVGVAATAPAAAPAASGPEDRAARRAETTFLARPITEEPARESAPNEFELELEGDWDESVPAPASPASAPRAPARPAPASQAPPGPAPVADAARRRAAALGGSVAGTRSTTSGGRILQYQRVENRAGLFGADLAQLPAATRFGLYALVLVGVAALAWGAYQLTATAKRVTATTPVEDGFGEG